MACCYALIIFDRIAPPFHYYEQALFQYAKAHISLWTPLPNSPPFPLPPFLFQGNLFTFCVRGHPEARPDTYLLQFHFPYRRPKPHSFSFSYKFSNCSRLFPSPTFVFQTREGVSRTPKFPPWAPDTTRSWCQGDLFRFFPLSILSRTTLAAPLLPFLFGLGFRFPFLIPKFEASPPFSSASAGSLFPLSVSVCEGRRTTSRRFFSVIPFRTVCTLVHSPLIFPMLLHNFQRPAHGFRLHQVFPIPRPSPQEGRDFLCLRLTPGPRFSALI